MSLRENEVVPKYQTRILQKKEKEAILLLAVDGSPLALQWRDAIVIEKRRGENT